MTFTQFKEQNTGRHFKPSDPIGFSFCGEFEPHPQPEDKIAHVEQPRKLTPEDCNGLSLQDSKDFHQFKHMDQLHKQDAVAKVHERSGKLRDRLQKDGTANFPKNYQKK